MINLNNVNTTRCIIHAAGQKPGSLCNYQHQALPETDARRSRTNHTTTVTTHFEKQEMSESDSIKDTYPQWLKDLAFDDCFDWGKGIYSTFTKFIEYATLHDSYWCGLFSNLDNSINLVVNFDAFWNKEIANHPSTQINEWPYLIIKIERVFNLTLESNMDCGTTIGDLKTDIITDDQKEKLIDNIGLVTAINSKIAENILDKKVSKTTIEDVCGGFIELIHTESIRLLLYESNGNMIELPEEMKVIKSE